MFLGDQTYLSFFDQANSDLYHLIISDNNSGGPSTISTATTKLAKQRSENQREARLLSSVKRSSAMGCVPKLITVLGRKTSFPARVSTTRKKCNDIKKEKCLDVLLTKQKSPGVNRGCRVVNNTMCT